MFNLWSLLQIVGVQVTSKVASFLVNRSAVKSDVSSFGVASFRLDLIVRSIVFLSREPFRKLSVRQTPSSSLSIFLWLIFPISIIVSLVTLGLIWYSKVGFDVSGFVNAVLLTVIAALIECVSEPFYNLNQFHSRSFSISNLIIALSFLVKSITILYFHQLNFSIPVSFALGHLSRSLFVLLFLFLVYRTTPIIATNSQGRNVHYYPLFKLFFVQTILKYCLTEFENTILYFSLTNDDLAVLTIIQSILVFVTKFLFLPMEELIHRTFSFIQNTLTKIFVLCRIGTFISIFFSFFLHLYGEFVLSTLFPDALLNHATIAKQLFLFSLTLPFLSINGISEAVLHSSANARVLSALNYYYSFISLVCAGFGFYLVKVFGLVGVSFSTIINMTLRIIVAFKYLNKSGVAVSVGDVLPRVTCLFSTVVSLFLFKWFTVHFSVVLVELSGRFIIFTGVFVVLGVLNSTLFVYNDWDDISIFFKPKTD
ncbi:hypothetical protein P9112_003514 [Eukaryota sp. TZLM1-RC]